MPDETETTTTETTTTKPEGTAAETPTSYGPDEVSRIVETRLAKERAKLNGLSFDEAVAGLKRLEELEEANKTELERAVGQAKKDADQAARDERDGFWRERILRSEVRAAAAGKLADPNDAVTMLDLKQFELDDDADPDGKKLGKALASAIEKLLADKPYLGAANGTQRRTDFDAGPRTPASGGEDFNATLRRQLGRQPA